MVSIQTPKEIIISNEDFISREIKRPLQRVRYAFLKSIFCPLTLALDYVIKIILIQTLPEPEPGR